MPVYMDCPAYISIFQKKCVEANKKGIVYRCTLPQMMQQNISSQFFGVPPKGWRSFYAGVYPTFNVRMSWNKFHKWYEDNTFHYLNLRILAYCSSIIIHSVLKSSTLCWLASVLPLLVCNFTTSPLADIIELQTCMWRWLLADTKL